MHESPMSALLKGTCVSEDPPRARPDLAGMGHALNRRRAAFRVERRKQKGELCAAVRCVSDTDTDPFNAWT